MELYRNGHVVLSRFQEIEDYIRRFPPRKLVVGASDDHPYCRVVRATIKQDYAGGGTYSTQTYRSSAQDDLFGCPAAGR